MQCFEGTDEEMWSEENNSRWTPLHIAAYYGNSKGVAFLLSKGVNVNTPVHSSGQTALMLACQHTRLEVCTILLGQQTLKKNIVDKLYRTPLDIVCQLSSDYSLTVHDMLFRTHLKICKQLLMKEFGDQLPKKRAELLKNPCLDNGFLEAFFTAWKDWHLVDDEGNTVMHHACLENSVLVIKRLMQNFNPSTLGMSLKNKAGLTPYECAIKGDNQEVIDALK